MQHFNGNGIDLCYLRSGKGVPLVLLHGYPLDHTIWDELVLLLQKDFDLIIPDLRGFGQTQAIDKVYTIDDMAADVLELLDYVNLDKVYIVGHSMGGYIALAFARLYPTRTLGLGLISSQALADSPEQKEKRYATAKQVAQEGVSAVEGMAEKLTTNAGLQKTIRSIIQRQKPAGIIGALKALAERSDSTPLLPTFSFPVTLIHGEADALIPIDRARDIKNVISHAHLLQLPDVGHMPMMENPLATAEGLQALLNPYRA
jgi:3-oxoadipate enol-lactonase